MKIAIVIVNYRTPGDTVACLRWLAAESPVRSGFRTVVVDNGSGDDSSQVIQSAIESNGWQDWSSLVALQENVGYAAGNNAAIRRVLGGDAAPDYVLLLNPDTIVRPGAMATLTQFMDARPQVGIAGARLEDPDGTPQGSAFRFPTILSELEAGLRLSIASRLLRRWVSPIPPADQAHRADWVAGAAMIIRRQVFDSVGLLDEGYFMYFEEVDFCLRAQRAGWECWYAPASHVVHLVGQSSGVTDTRRAPMRRPRYWFDSRRRFFIKHHGRWGTALANLAFASGYACWRVRRRLQCKPDLDPPYLLWDFLRHSIPLKRVS